MGKKLVIKGADFSENGFVVEIVKKEITDLYNRSGGLVETTTTAAESFYFYEASNGNLGGGGNLAGQMITRKGEFGADIDVEDYTDAEIQTRQGQGPIGSVAGVGVMFFLGANRQIIGGLSTGNSQRGCTNVGASFEQRTFSMKIPAGAKYVLCTASGTIGTSLNFKLTLSKKVVSNPL